MKWTREDRGRRPRPGSRSQELGRPPPPPGRDGTGGSSPWHLPAASRLADGQEEGSDGVGCGLVVLVLMIVAVVVMVVVL